MLLAASMDWRCDVSRPAGLTVMSIVRRREQGVWPRVIDEDVKPAQCGCLNNN